MILASGSAVRTFLFALWLKTKEQSLSTPMTLFRSLSWVPSKDYMDYMETHNSDHDNFLFGESRQKRHQRQDANIATVNLLVENQMAADCAPANN